MSERRDRLLSYIGREYTEEVVKQIQTEFAPYRVSLCEPSRFYLENYWINQIRCVVANGKITNLKFG
jgi:hypothetical protein